MWVKTSPLWCCAKVRNLSSIWRVKVTVLQIKAPWKKTSLLQKLKQSFSNSVTHIIFSPWCPEKGHGRVEPRPAHVKCLAAHWVITQWVCETCLSVGIPTCMCTHAGCQRRSSNVCTWFCGRATTAKYIILCHLRSQQSCTDLYHLELLLSMLLHFYQVENGQVQKGD